MQKLLLLLSIILCFSCSKENGTEVSLPERTVEVFSDQNFIRFNSDWNGEDMILNQDGSLTLVGNTRVFQPQLTVQPFIFNLDNQKNISWTNIFNLDDRNFYRRVELIPTQDQKYMVMTYSDSEANSDFNIDFLKVSSSGILNWSKQFNYEGLIEQVSSIVQIENRDYVAFGVLKDNLGVAGNKFLLLRMSENGEIVWSKILEDDLITFANEIFYLPSENAFIVLSEHYFQFDFQGVEVKMHKFNDQGDRLWTKSIFTAEGLGLPSSHLELIDNDQIFLAYSNDVGQSSPSGIVISKVDSDANIIWEKEYHGEEVDWPEDFVGLDDGNLILLSNTSSYGNGRIDLMLTKLNSLTGEIIWDKVYGTTSSDFGYKVVERPNGNIVVMGNSNHDNISEAQFELFILETDAEGNPV